MSNRYFMVPAGFILTGTCGACGGPLITPQVISSGGIAYEPPVETCMHCQRVAKTPVVANYGPIKEMQP
jgi:hypothetical protein